MKLIKPDAFDREYALRRYALRLEILHELSISLTQLERPREVAAKLIVLLPGIFDVRACAILMQDETRSLHPAEAMGISTSDLEEITVHLSQEQLTMDRSIRIKAGVIKGELKFTELLLVPLCCDFHHYGVLALLDRESRAGIIPFSEEDVSFMESIATVTAVALHNANLYSKILNEKMEKDAILDSSPVAIIATNPDGNIVSYNSSAAKHMGFNPEHTSPQYIWTDLIKGIPVDVPFSARNITITVPSGHIKGDINIVPLFDHSRRSRGVLITIQDISESNLVREMFQKYVSGQIVDLLVKEPERMKLGGEEKVVTSLYTDLRNFTGTSARITPEQTVWMLNEYYTVMVDIILKYNGTVDKIIGDGIMALFGAPMSIEQDSVVAVECAFEMMQSMDVVNRILKTKNLPQLSMGIGIDKGTVVAGNIGSPNIMTYTVIGHSANMSNRLCNNANPHEILITGEVYKTLPSKNSFRPTEPIHLKGNTEPVVLYSSLV